MAARAQNEAIAAYDRGDMAGTLANVGQAKGLPMAMPGSTPP